ncbi:MAG TPA: VCBS repeat-containing protein [Candidatus Binatia bacterium]
MKIRYAIAVAVFSLLFPLKSALADIDFKPQDMTAYATGAVDTNTGDPCTPPVKGTSKTCLALSTPSSIAVGDFNNDGKLDLAVLNQIPVKVGSELKFYLSVLLGNGDGTFSDTPILTETGGGTPCPSNANLATCDRGVVVLAGDFNEDGKDDVVIIYFGNPTGNNIVNGKVGMFLSNGDGTFAAPTYTSVGRGAVNGAVGQLTSSGHLDVVVVNREEDSFSVLLGDGTGGLSTALCDGVNPTCTAADGVGKRPAAVAIGQFDPDVDSVADLAVTSLLDQEITLWKGAGDGSFAPFATPKMEVTLQSIQVIAEDFNRDGKTDLAVLNQQTKNVTMLLNNGDGTFTELQKNRLLLGKTPVGMAAADFNGDGALDLAFVFFPGKLAGVFAGLGDGTFSTTNPVSLKVLGTSTGNFAVVAAPFDTLHPDRPHLAFANGKIAVMLNTSVFPDPGFHLTVTDPNGATTWTSGTPQTVTWDYAGFAGNFKIDLSLDGGDTFKPLVKTVANPNATSPLTATVKKGPTTKTPIANARVRVCSVEFPGICGQSPDFTLSP